MTKTTKTVKTENTKIEKGGKKIMNDKRVNENTKAVKTEMTENAKRLFELAEKMKLAKIETENLKIAKRDMLVKAKTEKALKTEYAKIEKAKIKTEKENAKKIANTVKLEKIQLVTTKNLALAKIQLDFDLNKIEKMTDNEILQNVAELIKTPKDMILSGIFKTQRYAISDLPFIAVKFEKDNKAILILKDSKTIKIDSKVTVISKSANNTISTKIEYNNKHIISVVEYGKGVKTYNFKNCEVINGKFTYNGIEYNMQSFQNTKTEKVKNYIENSMKNINDNDFAIIVKNGKQILIDNANKRYNDLMQKEKELTQKLSK